MHRIRLFRAQGYEQKALRPLRPHSKFKKSMIQMHFIHTPNLILKHSRLNPNLVQIRNKSTLDLILKQSRFNPNSIQTWSGRIKEKKLTGQANAVVVI